MTPAPITSISESATSATISVDRPSGVAGSTLTIDESTYVLRPGLRALCTQRSEALEREEHVGFEVFGRAMDLYFGGDMEAAIALGGQVVGRIDEVKPVARIIDETVAGFRTQS